jgi:hypothetical protein
MINILFSKNSKIGSVLISNGTSFLSNSKPTPSHVAILIKNKWVVESTMEKGCKVIGYKEWLEKNELLYSISMHVEFKDIKNLNKDLKNKKYDFLGVIYCGYRVLLNKLFGLTIPSKNKFHSKNRYFCCEVVGKLLNIETEMLSPVQLLDIIYQKQDQPVHI